MGQGASVAGGLVGVANVFVDPASTAKRIPSRGFWLWPLVILAGVYGFFAYLMLPFSLQLVDAQLFQRNIPPDRLEQVRNIAHAFVQWSVVISPVNAIVLIVFYAALILGFCSILGIGTRFRDVFSLTAACSLITALQYVATYLVIRSRGDAIENAEQLQPPFGIDLFTPGLHGPLLAILNFFSIFEIWYLIVLGLGLAFLTGVSKSKAFVAITPAVLIPLLFKVIGSLFSQ